MGAMPMPDLSENPRKPRRLHRGDTVGIVATSGSWANRSELLRGVAAIAAWGLKVKLGEHVNDRHGYLAGHDADRVADLHAMLADPNVDAIIAMRGGYGMSRLLPLLDQGLFAANPKAICGFSDLTTLHLAAAAWGDVMSFYSIGATGIGSPTTSEFSKASLQRALFSSEPYGLISPSPDDGYARGITGGRVSAPLAGGCSGVLISAIGTRLAPKLAGRIAVLEDVELEGAELDSNLTHLRNAGLLDGVVGIVVGDLRTKPTGGAIDNLSAEDIVEEVLGPLGVPILFGLPVGHGRHHFTVPFGAMATLDADAGTLIVEETVTSND